MKTKGGCVSVLEVAEESEKMRGDETRVRKGLPGQKTEQEFEEKKRVQLKAQYSVQMMCCRIVCLKPV